MHKIGQLSPLLLVVLIACDVGSLSERSDAWMGDAVNPPMTELPVLERDVQTDAGSESTDAGTGDAPSAPMDSGIDLPAPDLPSYFGGECPDILENGDTNLVHRSVDPDSREEIENPLRVYFRFDRSQLRSDGGLVIAFYQSCCEGGPQATGRGVLGDDDYLAGYAGDDLPEHFVVAGPYKETRGWTRAASIADSIVACARDQLDIDPRRIHLVGFSEGAYAARNVARQRSYVASVALFSGLGGSVPPDPAHAYAVMTGYGAADSSDSGHRDAMLRFGQAHSEAGHAVVSCDHGRGHVFPFEARPAAGRFLVDHPWGLVGTPWAVSLPSGVPDYCSVVEP